MQTLLCDESVMAAGLGIRFRATKKDKTKPKPKPKEGVRCESVRIPRFALRTLSPALPLGFKVLERSDPASGLPYFSHVLVFRLGFVQYPDDQDFLRHRIHIS
jgi:hypothetical protein